MKKITAALAALILAACATGGSVNDNLETCIPVGNGTWIYVFYKYETGRAVVPGLTEHECHLIITWDGN